MPAFPSRALCAALAAVLLSARAAGRSSSWR